MTQKTLLTVALIGLSSIAVPAAAQYVGTSTAPSYATVSEVLKDPIDDVPVTFEGYLVKKIANKKYIFSDGVAQIRVDIDPKHFPTTPINEKTRVVIRGEVEKDFMESPEIDVDSLSVVVVLAK